MTGALVDPTPQQRAELSTAYDTPEYRAAGRAVRWSAYKGTREHCAECAARQHETRGAYGPRMRPTQRRALPGGPTLLLCGCHAQAWRDRDGQAPEKGQDR